MIILFMHTVFRVRFFIMGFPSPAKDYVEQTLTINRLCQIDANCRVLETSSGYAVIDVSRRPKQGDHVLIACCGIIQ